MKGIISAYRGALFCQENIGGCLTAKAAAVSGRLRRFPPAPPIAAIDKSYWIGDESRGTLLEPERQSRRDSPHGGNIAISGTERGSEPKE